MSLPERIKTLRGDLTQADFAARVGINVNTLRNYERGDSIPNMEVAASICRYFNISGDWLLFGDGPMRRQGLRVGDFIPPSAYLDAAPSGLEQSHETARAMQPAHAEPPSLAEDFKMSEMLTKTAEVLESETIYRTALASNINAFHQAVRSERTLARLEERVALLEAKDERVSLLETRMEELANENAQLKRRLEHQDENNIKAVGADG